MSARDWKHDVMNTAAQVRILRPPLDIADRSIVMATQAGLPVTPRPFDTLSRRIGLPSDEIIRRMRNMVGRGVIRRLGAVPNHYNLGFIANGMSVWDVPDNRISELGARIGALPAVSHCYHRPRRLPEWPYNLFAMVHGRCRAEVERRVAEIAHIMGDDARAHEVLYSTKVLKKTGLRLRD